MPRGPRFAFRLMPLAALAFVAASPVPESTAEDLIRRANGVYPFDRDEANRLYEAAEVLTADPGLVAFNRAAVLFQNERYNEAATYYFRVLRDAACPPERAARTWYNLGTCLIKESGASSAVYDQRHHLLAALSRFRCRRCAAQSQCGLQPQAGQAALEAGLG